MLTEYTQKRLLDARYDNHAMLRYGMSILDIQDILDRCTLPMCDYCSHIIMPARDAQRQAARREFLAKGF